MKITILGNSNALLKDGWCQSLRHSLRDAEVVNLSVGGSASPALLYQLLARKHDVKNSDFIVIEPTVVDHGCDWQSPAKISTYAAATIDYAKSTGARVILLVLPRHAEFVKEPSPGMVAWSAAARRAEISVVDARLHLLPEAEKLNCKLNDLWRDNYGHLNASMQSLIGKLVAGEILGAAGAAGTDGYLIEESFRVLSGEEIALENGRAPIMRETSVMSLGVAQLAWGETLTLDIGISDAILGFMVNYGNLYHDQPAFLNVSAGDGSDLRQLNLANTFLTAEPTRKLVAMFRPVNIPAGHCRLEFVGSGSQEDSPDFLELCGILIGPETRLNRDWDVGGIGSLE